LEKGMNWQGITHFLTGYNEFLPFTSDNLAKAFQLTWCQESPWWITHDIEGRDENPKRFFEEICWISENWNHLEDLTRSHVEVLK
jgi:homoserine kinase type II